MNPIWLLAPVMCYIVEGPDPDKSPIEEIVWRTLTSAPEDDEGVISNTYGYNAASASVINDGVTEIGPVSGIYDPEWFAFLAGELI